MTAVVFPQRAVVVYVKALFDIAGEATRDALTLNRDAATLTRQAFKLVDGDRHGRVMGVLRKYVTETNQFGADKVKEIVAEMERFVDPKIAQQNKDIKYRREARKEERREREEAEERGAWETGGKHWTAARDQMMADAHALIYAAKTIGDGDGERLARALREYSESEERDKLFERLADNLKPPPEVKPAPSKRRSRARPRAQDGNVVTGPWGAAGEARP